MNAILSWLDWYFTAPADTAGVLARLAIVAPPAWLAVGLLIYIAGKMVLREHGRSAPRFWWLAIPLGPLVLLVLAALALLDWLAARLRGAR